MQHNTRTLRALRASVAGVAITVALAAPACSGDSDDEKPAAEASTTTDPDETTTTLPKSVTTVDGATVPDPCTFITDAELQELFEADAELETNSAPIINGKSCVRSATVDEVTSTFVTSIQETDA